MNIISRFEDMSKEDGVLRLIIDDDGDIFVEVCEEGSVVPQSVEFCNSCTRSPRTYAALRQLAKAMMADELARPD
jgi:hypothetical protein